MDDLKGVFLGCLLGIVGLTQAQSAIAADDAAVLHSMRELSSRIYATTRDIGNAHAQSILPTPLDARIRALKRTIDAILKQAIVADEPARTPTTRKAQSLSRLIENLERVDAHPSQKAIASLVPQHSSTAHLLTFAGITDQRGGNCAHPLGFGAQSELTGTMPDHGELWLRLDTHGLVPIRVDTTPSALDTEIAVFKSCAEAVQGKAESSNDDARGLAAAVSVIPTTRNESYLLRIRDLGEAGAFSVVATDGGLISGRVTDAISAAPLADAELSIFDDGGSWVNSAYVDVNGYYEIALEAGNYALSATATDHVTQAWPGAECSDAYELFDCAAGWQTLAVTTGNSLAGIDFALGNGAQINGHVHQAGSGMAIADAQISVTNSQRQTVASTYSDDAGRYRINTLAAGTYFIEAVSTTSNAEVFDGQACPPPSSWCDPLSGTPVLLQTGQSRDSVDFNLSPLLYANVSVSTLPSNYGYTTIIVYDANGTQMLGFLTFADEVTSVGPLLPGSYHFVAEQQGFFTQLYANLDCATDCVDQLGSGTLVTIAEGAPAPTVAFSLHPQASVRGHVTDAGTGVGLNAVSMSLWPADGSFWSSQTQTAIDGTYAFTGVASGSYWLVARSVDHRDTAFANAPCGEFGFGLSGCQLAQAQEIVVGTTDISSVDLVLPLNASISGAVSYRGPATSPLGYVDVTVYGSDGISLRDAYTAPDGTYVINDLTPGSYFAEATSWSIYGQVYAGIDCPLIGYSCGATGGTPIVVSAGQTLADIDFGVIGSRRLTGRVIDSVSGNGLGGIAIDTWDGQSDQHCGDAATDAQGYFAVLDDASCSSPSRKVSTDGGAGHVDQVYKNILCDNGSAWLGLCSLQGATLVTFPTGQPQLTQVNFALAPDVIFHNGFD